MLTHPPKTKEKPMETPDPVKPLVPPEIVRLRDRSGWSFMLAALCLGVAIVCAEAQFHAGAIGVVLVMPVLLLHGLLTGVSGLKQALNLRKRSVGFLASAAFTTFMNGMALAGIGFTFFVSMAFSRGRQLRRLGKVLLPKVREGGAWARIPMNTAIEEAVRPGLAAQWRENGRSEHASVAAFARLTLDLMALGAPPTLIAEANRDSLDEIRHAELCFSLARELDGRSESPTAFPEAKGAHTLPPTRTLALAALAVDSLVDGALHEGVSARIIARLARVCEDPQTRSVLKEIAADEGRHSAHGWEVVEWCLAEGGPAVESALHGALRVLPMTMHGDLPPEAENGSWERYGIHGRSTEAEEYGRARADLVARVERMITRTVAAAA
jgi:hypothetical protein